MFCFVSNGLNFKLSRIPRMHLENVRNKNLSSVIPVNLMGYRYFR